MTLKIRLIAFIFLALTAMAPPRGAEARKRPTRLRPSAASLARQNRYIDRLKLMRFRTRAQLERYVKNGALVPITDTEAYFLDQYVGYADPGHEALYRHARPWAKDWLDRELGRLHRLTGETFRVTSLVRTDRYQSALHRRNRAAIVGEAWWKRSSHVAGATVDISYLGLKPATVKLFEERLIQLMKEGKIEAFEEDPPACFHIQVLPAYSAKPHARRVK